MKEVEVVFVECRDFSALYVDGVLEKTDNPDDVNALVSLIRKYKYFKSIDVKYLEDGRLEELGYNFPVHLSDVFR